MIIAQNIKINRIQVEFLRKYRDFGFKDENELITQALKLLQKKIEKNKGLRASADLYAELYEQDKETQFLTESAINDWE